MAPIKFEEQLKEKLEKRTLSPSEGSWSKLAERLDTEEKRNKKPIYWWLGIAAGLVILMAVAIQFFNTEDNESVMPTVVEEEAEKSVPKPIDILSDEIKTNALVAKDEVSNNNDKKSTTTTKSSLIDYKKTVRNQSKSQVRIAENKSTQEGKLNTQNDQKPKQDLQNGIGEDELRESVATALKSFKSEATTVTDREVDSLLKMASKELLKGKLLKDDSRTVDASSLLISVEEELGESFRTKVFEALKDSYETIKTAVVHRNH